MHRFFSHAEHAVVAAFPVRRAAGKGPGVAALAFAVLAAAATPLLAHDFRLGDLEIDHPWSRATPEGAEVAAGYVRIVNHGTEPDRLVAVSGAIAPRAEFHEMAVDDKGVMTMRPVDGLDIPAGGEVAFAPGGYHIMFLDLADPKAEGERFAGSLTFEKAGTIEVEFVVEAMGGPAGHADHHAGHDAGD